MSIGAVLETAIGVIFVFLLLGLMASALQEAFAAMTKLRGKYLLEGLSRLLADNKSAFWRVKNPANMFGRPMQNVAEEGSTAGTLFRTVVGHPLVTNSGSNTAPSYLTPANFFTAIVDGLRKGEPQPDAETTPAGNAPANPAALMAEIAAGIDNLPEGPAKRALGAVFAESQQNLDQFKKRVEAWFDAAMERVSGVYKRFSQYFALGFGLLIAIGLNIDTIQVAEHLWRNPETRAAFAAAADAYIAANPTPAATANTADPNAVATPPVATTTTTTTPATTTPADVADKIDQALAIVGQLDELGLPMGRPAGGGLFSGPGEAEPGQDPRSPLLYILGWLLTALAVSLGAPFWFDLLKKFMRIRASGKAPDEAT